MGSSIEALLRQMSSAFATDVFVTLTVAVFLIALYQAEKGRHSQFLEYAPGIMTSLGILGTFVGIVIGLLAFNVDDIDGSIKALLAGMKTAFITSLVGMLLSVIFKVVDAWRFSPRREQARMPDQVRPEHILASMEKQNDKLELIGKALIGAEEGSLIGQLKLIRSDANDANGEARKARVQFEEKLWVEMREFAEILSKSATAQIVDALRQVIQDFNEKLTEQFGENFKALDASVKKLVEWQDRYSGQVELMGAQFEQSAKSLGLSEAAVQLIATECRAIPAAMGELRDVLDVNQHQIAELQRHLEVFVQMRDEAIQAVPQLTAKVEEIAQQMSAGAVGMGLILAEKTEEFDTLMTRSNVAVKEMAMAVTEQSEKLTTEMAGAVDELTATSREMVRSLETASKTVHEQIKSATQDMAETVQRETGRVLSGVEQQVKSAVERTGEAVNVQMSALDRATQQELERVLSHFGTSLARISDGFVTDYDRLTKRLAELSRVVA